MAMSDQTEIKSTEFDPEKARLMLIAAEQWTAKRNAEKEQQRVDWRAQLAEAAKQLPEKAEIPYERTPEGERAIRFKKAFQDELVEFLKPIDRKQLKNPLAFDRVAGWDGQFRGPLAHGLTGGAKTRAAVAAVEHLFVKKNLPFTWFPVSRLVDEVQRFEKKDLLDEFYRSLLHYPVVIVDDLDKINWNRQEEPGVLFRFYDWVYRAHRPVITTTNKPRAWWLERVGEAFVRRLFDEAHFEVKF